MKNTDSISNRLKTAMSIRDIKQADLVEKTGIPKGSISQYVSGYVEPKSDRIYLLAKALSVDPVWLMGMDVPMEKQIASVDYMVDEMLVEVADITNRMTVEENLRKFIVAYLSLSADKKKLVEEITYGFLPNNGAGDN